MKSPTLKEADSPLNLLSISAIPDAGDESHFGPLWDTDLANQSIFDIQKQLDEIEDGLLAPMGELRVTSRFERTVGELSDIKSPVARPDDNQQQSSTEAKILAHLQLSAVTQNFSMMPAESSFSVLSASNIMNRAFIQESSAGNEERLEVESNMLGDLQSELRRQSPLDTNASPNQA